MRTLRGLILTYFGLVLTVASAPSAQAVPTTYAFGAVPARFHSLDLSASSRALGEICYSLEALPDSAVCNPAYLPEYKETNLLARIYVGNGYAAMSMANQFLFQPVSKEFLQSLFRGGNVTSLEAHLGLAFTMANFTAGFSPHRVQYVSEVHNPNLPVIAVHAAIERSLFFGAGTTLTRFGAPDWSVGMKTRLLTRRYVHGAFSLFDAVSQEPSQLLPVREQRALYFEPSVAWTKPELRWRPRVSVGVTSFGFRWPEEPLFDDRADLAAGVGVEPPVGFGRLRLGMDLVRILHGQDLLERLRMGASYRVGILEPMLGWSELATTFGMQFSFQMVQASVVYELSRSDLAGGSPENKISTELALRL